MLAALGGLPGGARVRTLFNTHWHLDQIGSNDVLGRAGAAIVAHEKTRQRLATGYYLPAEDRYQPPAPKEAQPTESIYTTGETKIGREQIEYGYLLEAHTDGDIYVFFRDSNVLAVGDAVSPERDPELDWFGGGWLGGRVDSLKLLLGLGNAQTRIVPSYGPVVDRAAVQKEYDMMLRLFESFVELVRKGDSAEDVLAAGVMDVTGRAWADPRNSCERLTRGCGRTTTRCRRTSCSAPRPRALRRIEHPLTCAAPACRRPRSARRPTSRRGRVRSPASDRRSRPRRPCSGPACRRCCPS